MKIARLTTIGWNLLAPIGGVLLWLSGHGWWALALVASAHVSWLIPTLLPNCDWYGEVITKLPYTNGLSNDPAIWLTIDDGPDPEDTPLLLDLLDQHHAKATFFHIGVKASAHPLLVHEVLRRGHSIGNHTMNHPLLAFWAYGPKALSREIEGCNAAVAEASGTDYRPRWFRAPAGFKNPLVHALLEKINLRYAGWSARGLDGVLTNLDRIHANLCAGIKPRAILLMHEGKRNEKGETLAPQVLRRILAELSRQNYRCVLPDEAASS